MALVKLDGEIVLANPPWSTRFGSARLVAGSLVEPGDDCRVTVGDGVEVQARIIALHERWLLVLDEPRTVELRSLRERVSMLERLAATDHLTGAWNRAHFDRLIDGELARASSSRQPVSLVLLDIDHFKTINDTFGHAAGDSVLCELVGLVQARTRASDVLFRWGGEEFAVLASSVGYRGAERLAENLCQTVAQHSFRTVGSVTVSLGVAEYVGTVDAGSLFKRLDAALYAAKDGGRNRVVVDRRGNSDVWAAEGSSALHLVWQEAYECGDATIDGEHRELFVLANRLIDAAFRGEVAPTKFRVALEELIAHVQRHFADEEAILARLHYADLEPHKRSHAGLLRRAAFLRERAQAGEATLGAVVEFLAQDVVARHLMAVDRAFFPLFEKRATLG
jgi:diguanylate cyclase (GGDEF)-like protein/hemerythrin-like metal-binding protein